MTKSVKPNPLATWLDSEKRWQEDYGERQTGKRWEDFSISEIVEANRGSDAGYKYEQEHEVVRGRVATAIYALVKAIKQAWKNVLALSK